MVAKWATTSTSQATQSSVGGGGSPFPPLGFAASGLTTPTSHFHEPSTPTSSSSSLGTTFGLGGGANGTGGGLPPAPTKFDASQAQQRRLQDAYWSDDEVSEEQQRI